jgi:L-serine dehydratase
MGLLDVIGPVMVGPSSSHTAGACRLALLARRCLLSSPQRATLTLHGSFAKTAKGHGTDRALAAGLLGYFPDDPRIPDALEQAAAQGLQITFGTKDLGDVHPNTVHFSLENEAETLELTGSSLGGGLVKVFKVFGFDAAFSGAHHTLLLEHHDKPGVIASVTRVLADDAVNIATLHCARNRRGERAMMSLELEQAPAQHVLDYLSGLGAISWLRLLPDVMGSRLEAQA